MRICVIHQYYLSAGEPGISRYNEMARLWADAGHQVTIIAGTVNHYTGVTPDAYRRRWVTRERDGAVEVFRCFVPSAYGRSYLGRRLGYAAFALSASYAALVAPPADVVIATSPPLVVVAAGWLKRRVSGRRARWIFEVRDLWPESAVTTGVILPGSPTTRFFYALEAWAYRSADRITALTPGIKADIVRRHLAPASKIVEVPNGADLVHFAPAARDNDFRRRFGWGDRCVAMYAGAHGRANALDQLVEAAALLRDRPDIVIALVGDGPERVRLERDARERGLTNLTFCGPQPKERMAECVNAADIGIAVLQPNPTFRTVYPNKIFDYMACARPIVLGIDGVARDLVCDVARCGVCVPPGDAAGLAAAIRSLADRPAEREAMGLRGRRWVEANASREALAANYLSIMNDLVHLDPGS